MIARQATLTMPISPETASLMEFIDSKQAEVKRMGSFKAFFTICSPCLLSFHTEKLVIVLRDGKKIIGTLRSYDQFGRSKYHDHYACI